MKKFDDVDEWNDGCNLTHREFVDFAEIVFHETRPGASQRISRQLVELADDMNTLMMWADHLWPRSLWKSPSKELD